MNAVRLRKLCFFAAAFCVVLLVSGPAVGAEYQYARLLVDEDALVNQSQASKNYGSLIDLLVGDVTSHPIHDGGLCRSYLKWDVGSVLPADATVVNAELLLCLHETYPSFQQRTIESCYVPTDTWTEGTITWSTAPAYNAATTGIVTSTFNSPNSYYCWNVTPDVITAMGDNGVYSTAMVMQGEPAGYWNNFYSRDLTPLPDYRPYLEIVYTVPGTVVSGGSEGYNPQPGSGLDFGPTGLPPIPADFFGPGSDPFEGQISLGGGGTPMVINRTEGVYLPDSAPSAEVPTEIQGMSLKSTEPIRVTFDGGMVESFFDVFVELDMPSPGTAIVSAAGGGGGGGCIYQETPLQQLRLEFVNVNDPLDTKELQIPGGVYPQQIMMAESTELNWQGEITKEGEVLGYDGFYMPEGQIAHCELMYDAAPTGMLDYSPLQEVPPRFCITTEQQWLEALGIERVRGFTNTEWDEYISQFNDNASEPYPDTTFLPPELYVCGPEGGGDGTCECEDPQEAGLVMKWGDDSCEDGEDYASAWVYEYAEDPDLTGCVLTTTVYPPCGMNIVSIGLKDVNGNIRGWYWNVAAAGAVPPYPAGTIACSPAPGPGPGAVPTSISIDLTKTGVGAATPAAASYSNNPAFDITKVAQATFDENNTWIDQTQMPAPGSGVMANWNYWKNLVVTKKTPPAAVDSKYYVKWSQKPKVINEPNDPKTIYGWDERSNYHWRPIVADDWLCEDDRPVTDIHWWGSFLGWNDPEQLPSILPKAFHIAIWTDIPVGADPDVDFSHPGFIVWENYCDNWVWNFYGYDRDPHWGEEEPNVDYEPWETCFQFNQLLSQDEWFYQDPNMIWPWDDLGLQDPYPNGTVYWLSISAVYDPDLSSIPHPWGWKTREPSWNDDAVRIWEVTPPNIDYPPGYPPANWPPSIGYEWEQGDPIWWPTEADSWDVCFELTTNEPAPEEPNADLNEDGIVDFSDFAVMADQWLTSGP